MRAYRLADVSVINRHFEIKCFILTVILYYTTNYPVIMFSIHTSDEPRSDKVSDTFLQLNFNSVSVCVICVWF